MPRLTPDSGRISPCKGWSGRYCSQCSDPWAVQSLTASLAVYKLWELIIWAQVCRSRGMLLNADQVRCKSDSKNKSNAVANSECSKAGSNFAFAQVYKTCIYQRRKRTMPPNANHGKFIPLSSIPQILLKPSLVSSLLQSIVTPFSSSLYSTLQHFCNLSRTLS